MNRLVLCGVLLSQFAAATVDAQDSAHVVIAATTDVHGRAYHWNYVSDGEAPWGLTRVATVVDSLRALYPGQVVLVDVGDLIQGNAFARYHSEPRAGEPHRVVDALNAVQYDVATIGNHDFDFGFDALRRAISDAAYPVVSGNVYRLPRDTFAFQPEVVLSRSGVRVGVTGFTTPGVMVWHREKLAGEARVRRIVPAADRAMRRLQRANVDLRVAAVHSGMGMQSSYDTTGVGPENVAAQLAHLPVKPHVVLVGHSHARLSDTEINGVNFIQPAPWALSVAVVHVYLARRTEDEPYRVTEVVGEEVSVADVEPHPALVRRLESAHQAVREWMGTRVASVTETWNAQFSRAEDTPIIDLVNEIQRRVTGADLSATPSYDPNVRFGPDQVSMRDVASLYPHENTLKAVLIDGESLRQYLERSAEYFLTFTARGEIINSRVPGYDFDIVSGVDYTIDLTRPAGSRIRQITHNGQIIKPGDVFSMAINSHRQGGGGFDMLIELPVVYDRGEDVRTLLTEAISSIGVLRTEDYFDPSWSIMPPEAAQAVRNAFSSQSAVTQPYATESPADTTQTTVFAVEDTAETEAQAYLPFESAIAEMKFHVANSAGENSLGRLVADARRNGVRAHFGIISAEAIEADLPAGLIYATDLSAILPLNDSLTRITLTGEELRAVLEHVVAEEQPIAHVSGIEVWYDPRRDRGRRVRRIEFPDGRRVRDGQTYVLAASTRTVADTARFETLQWLPAESVGLTDHEALSTYLQRLRQPVEAPADDRIHSTR